MFIIVVSDPLMLLQQSMFSHRVSWDGNIAVEGCSDCCMRWYISIDGHECENPGPIDAAIRADLLESGSKLHFTYSHPSLVCVCAMPNDG